MIKLAKCEQVCEGTRIISEIDLYGIRSKHVIYNFIVFAILFTTCYIYMCQANITKVIFV